MSIEIIGCGYGKEDEDLNIGDTYLQECVVNMWELAPKNAFVYYSANNTQMVLKEYTKTDFLYSRIKEARQFLKTKF